MKQSDLEELLVKEKYDELITFFEKNDSRNTEESFYLGISYYKKNQFTKAESIFKALYKSESTIEMTTYYIISKIKLGKNDEANRLYKDFCERENKTITTYLKNRDYQNALAICLLLKSIPIELPKNEPVSNNLIELTNGFNYSELSLELAKKINH